MALGLHFPLQPEVEVSLLLVCRHRSCCVFIDLLLLVEQACLQNHKVIVDDFLSDDFLQRW